RCHRHLADHRANHRYLEHRPVDETATLLVSINCHQADHQGDNATHQVKDVFLQPLGRVDHELGRRGQRLTEVGEHLGEHRSHLDQQESGHADGNDDHDDWIDHHAFDL